MDLFQSRKRPGLPLDDEDDSDVGGMMNNGVQSYRVTGGGNNTSSGSGGSGGNNDSGMTYRVVNSSSGDNNSNNSNNTSGTTALNNVQAVLASPINGQFYVIGNPSDVLGGTVGQRTIAPRTGSFTADPISLTHHKEDKLGTRRATHNEVERRRRDNINNWIMKLSKLLPECNSSSSESGVVGVGAAAKQSQSKGGILAKACEYLAEMRNTNQRLVDSIKQTEEISAENERLSTQLEQLQQENEALKQQLQNHGIVPQNSSDLDFKPSF